MRLHLYREHLARELEQLPDFRAQEIQSYVLTTAILSRRIDDRLRGRLKSERVEPLWGRQLDFRQLVGLLIHYRLFVPSLSSTTLSDAEATPADFSVRVYSDTTKNKHDAGTRLTIKLADYFAIVGKIASDDVFVLQHLLAATITRLTRASRIEGDVDPDDLNEIAASIDDVIWLSRKLIDTTNLPLRDVPLHASDLKFRHRGPGDWDLDEYLVASDLCPTLGSLTDGYGTRWHYTPFRPSRIDGAGYCLGIEVPDPNFRPMALPFSMLADAFAEVKNRLPEP